MYVADVSLNDDFLTGVKEALAPADGTHGARVLLIAGPPGFGKTSVLSAAASLTAQQLDASVIWLSGGVIASEGHLAHLIATSAGSKDSQGQGRSSLDLMIANLQDMSGRTIVLAIDDLDALVFKRERIAEQIASLLAAAPTIRLLATCHPASADRLSTAGHPLGDAMIEAQGHVRVVTIRALDDAAARALIRRRTPRLPDETARLIINAAGGHPAALVFLSRLAELRAPDFASRTNRPVTSHRPTGRNSTSPREVSELIERAAEFAGAVYAESWAGLGPQQRAILWQLGSAGVPTTASEIAEAIELPASHVSAQLSRLMADGLVRRTDVRGQFTSAPLLARWIARRAARGQGDIIDRRGSRNDHGEHIINEHAQKVNSEEGFSTHCATPKTPQQRSHRNTSSPQSNSSKPAAIHITAVPEQPTINRHRQRRGNH